MANRVNRFRVHRSNIAGPVRETLWFGGTYTITTLAAGTPVLLTSLNAAALAMRPFTIVRTRGALLVGSDQTAAGEVQRVAYGKAVVSDQASLIGITAVPTPITDDGSDLWFVYQPLLGLFRLADATGIVQNNFQQDIDSKAMRKVDDGQDVVTVIENTGNGADILAYSRLLIKLH